MRNQFPHRLYTQKLFCRRCRRVTYHGLFAKEPYSTYGGMAPHIPLLCSCDDCGTTFVAFSQEFSIGNGNKGTEYTKIYGKNRIVPGNWLYFKDKLKPGVVKSCFQSEDKEVFLVSYDGAPPEKIECPKIVIQNEEAPEGYRLVPAQTAHVLIGDHVYHAIREQFGIAVGLVSDGGKDKLAILLDDNSLLFITIPQSMQNVPNAQLSEAVRQKLASLFPEDSRRVLVTVGQGIIYLDGIVRSLAVKRALCACVNSMPRVRGCVDFMRVQMETYISDERLENSIWRILDTPAFKIFDYSAEVKDSKAVVKASCFDSNFPKDLENRIADLPGLQELSMQMSPVPESSSDIQVTCRVIEKELAGNSRLGGTVISLNYFNNKYVMEGRVSNAFQKQWALINAVKMVRSASIENRLRVC
jgi:osmotically-inducible protein OsmY